jgi:hypothetical protein
MELVEEVLLVMEEQQEITGLTVVLRAVLQDQVLI